MLISRNRTIFVVEVIMNILKSNNKNESSYLMRRIRPDFEFSDNDLISYVYCKACRQINLKGHEYDSDLLRLLFTENELKELGSTYIDIVKDKEPRKYDHFRKEDNSYDFIEILDSFSESLKHKPDIYFGLLYYGCQKKLDTVFKDSNPFSRIVNCSFMQNISRALNLEEYETIFLCLSLINHKKGLLFNDNMALSSKLSLLRQFYNGPVQLKDTFFQQINNRFIKYGLFANEWEINDFIYSYFSGDSYPFKLNKVSAEEYGDCFSMDSISTENFNDINVIDKILKQCQIKNKGCYITLSDANEYRIKNYVSYYNHCNGYDTFEITSDISDFDKNNLILYLILTSSQLHSNKALLLLDSSLLHNLLSEKHDNSNTIRIFSDSTERTANTANEINYFLFQNILTPVYLLTNELNYEELALLNNNTKIVYKWNLKVPSKNEYQDQFIHFLAKKKINENILSTVASECNRLKIKSKKWNDVAELVSVLGPSSDSDIKQLISANFDEPKDKRNLRKSSHYSLEALKTTEPVENIVKALKNAEKWQESEYDCDSGIRILNYGLSGTGKTAFVENAARMLDRPLKIIRASDILGMYVGETEQNIKNAFMDAAKTNSILLIDEADSFLHGRGDSINRHNDSKVNEFLVQMERFPGILFCNTNLPDNLDTATDRRFHKKIGFNPIDKKGISLLLKSYFEKFEFTENQIEEIFDSGDVTPGDFGTLFGQIRFFAPEDLSSDYICEELKKLVKGKKRSWEKNRQIGFGA